MDMTEKTLESREVYRGRILRVREDRVRLPNGKEGVREVVEHPGGVGILALDGDDVLPLLNGDVQKALDAFENTKEQFASEVSFDLIDEGMAHDMVYIIRTDLNK